MINIPNPHGGGAQHPSKIIIHAMGEFIDTETTDYYAPYYLAEIGLSAHYLVTPSGTIIQTRADNYKAWHAKGHNTDSIGIEVLVEGEHTYDTFLERIKENYVTERQYCSLVDLVKSLRDKYGISEIMRHSDVSPERKFDPGVGFPWDKFICEI